jgi:hypothetical protein
MGLRGYSNLRQFQMCCLVKIAHYAVSNIGSVATSICTHNPVNECKGNISTGTSGFPLLAVTAHQPDLLEQFTQAARSFAC